MLRSLGAAGIRPTVLINHCKNPVVALSRFRGEARYYDSVSQIPDILKQYYAKDTYPPVLICCDDAIQEAVDKRYEELKNHFILSDINQKQGEIAKMMNKQRQMAVAREAGITVPPTWFFHKGEKVTDDVIYPCFAKTDNSIYGSKADMHICNSREELQPLVDQKNYLVQEYIKKDFEIILWGTSLGNGEYFMTGVGHKLRHQPPEIGMSSFGIVESFEDHPGLDKAAVLRFLKALNYTGMFSIEMAVRNGKYYFLEINLRNDGKQHFSTVAGANLPEMYIKSRLNLPVEMPKMRYPTYYMGELTDFQYVKSGDIKWKDWLRDVRRTDSFFILNWRDPLPFASELWTKICDTIRYRLGLVK
jgi:predicted ATP-grasp superfamily ATP-dependent carboligase